MKCSRTITDMDGAVKYHSVLYRTGQIEGQAQQYRTGFITVTNLFLFTKGYHWIYKNIKE